ncbi:hypothetical protein Salat_2086200 [Sesamum alatum]|uniref:Uncharacterized protein n=1 Tax=Sesamum alatum TaxID=300844 RepID=A0AAE1Y0Q1_9LAMI|nr:hypothetical protein Salat_2086200 [Sesamum alatum]
MKSRIIGIIRGQIDAEGRRRPWFAWRRRTNMQQQRPAKRAGKLASVQPFLQAPHVKYVPAFRQFVHQLLLLELRQANRARFVMTMMITRFSSINDLQFLKPGDLKIQLPLQVLIVAATAAGLTVRVDEKGEETEKSLGYFEKRDPYTRV